MKKRVWGIILLSFSGIIIFYAVTTGVVPWLLILGIILLLFAVVFIKKHS